MGRVFIYILRRNQSVDPPGAPCWEALLRARISGHVGTPGVHVLCVYSGAVT